MSETTSEEKKEITQSQKKDVLQHQKDEHEENELGSENTKAIIAQIASEFSGPLPPPKIMRGYEEILPGAADRIMKMAEQQSAHRQSMEKKMIEAEARDSLLGVLFAFLLGFGCLLIGAFMAIKVPESAGVIGGSLLGIAGIGSIVTTFLKTTRSNYKNRSDENE